MKFKQFLKENITVSLESELIELWNVYVESKNEKDFNSKTNNSNIYSTLQQFSKQLHSKSKAKFVGGLKVQTSDFWKQITGKSNDTSKSDLQIADNFISMKKQRSQIMSAGKSELKALTLCALKKSKLDKQIKAEIIEQIDKMIPYTRTYKVNVEKLNSMKNSNIKNEQNKLAKQLLEKSKDIRDSLITIFEKSFQNPEFKNNFVLESLTGSQKFSDLGFADYLLVSSNDLSDIKLFKIELSENYIKKIINNFEVSVSMKSTKANQDYVFFQTFRVIIDDMIKTIEESFIDNIKDFFVNLYDKIYNFINKIKQLVEDGIEKICDVFGFDFDVSTSGTIDI